MIYPSIMFMYNTPFIPLFSSKLAEHFWFSLLVYIDSSVKPGLFYKLLSIIVSYNTLYYNLQCSSIEHYIHTAPFYLLSSFILLRLINIFYIHLNFGQLKSPFLNIIKNNKNYLDAVNKLLSFICICLFCFPYITSLWNNFFLS